MNVLHLPTDVGGNAWGLSRGERTLGLHSETLVETQTKFGYLSDICLGLDKIPSGRGLKFLKSLSAFCKIRNKYDIFHFNFGRSLISIPNSSFFFNFDLPLYPKKAKLFVTYNGCDARQKYPTMCRTPLAACHNPACYGGMCNSGTLDRERKRGIEKMSRYTRHMWALNPDLLYFLPKEKSSFLPYTVSKFEDDISPPKFEKKLKIVHAPTQRELKGSSFIIHALQKLKTKYPTEFEFTLIENLPHQQALALYREADLIIDQLMIGWYGAFAVETMLMGKPVVVRIAKEDLHFIPKQMAEDLLNTIIPADPSNIYSVLERCIQDRGILKEHAQASIPYARKWHHPKYVASLTKEKYEL